MEPEEIDAFKPGSAVQWTVKGNPFPSTHLSISNNHHASSLPWKALVPLLITPPRAKLQFFPEVPSSPSLSVRGLQFLTCHMLDSMCNFLIRGGGDGTQHLLQVWHPQMGMGPFPTAHGRLLAHFLFGGLSVDLSQVRSLRFGQFTLCRDSKEKHLIKVALALQQYRLKPSNGTAAGPKKLAGSKRPMPRGHTTHPLHLLPN